MKSFVPMMPNVPRVSIYIPNHNYGSYIEQAIQSVLDQTFQDFEIIVIDDGSSDNSLDIIRKCEMPGKVILIEQKHQGLVVSNNIALKLARGKYIMRLDADDFLDPRALEVMVSALEGDQSLALVFPDYYEVDEQGKILVQVRRQDFEKEVSLKDRPAHGACTMIRTEVLVAVGGYDEAFTRQDGYDLWLKVIDGHRVKNINLPLFYYRQHASSLTSDEEILLATRAKIFEKHAAPKGKSRLSVLTVIPIRGNTIDARSLPLKHLKGKPLIDWTLQAALRSDMLDDIVVTTPDKKVLDHVWKTYAGKIQAFVRNPELARINAGLEETLFEILLERGDRETDAVMVLNVESPFRSETYLNQAIHTMKIFDVDVVCGVRQDDDIFYIHDGGGLKPRVPGNGLRLERDDLYRKVGGMTLVRSGFLQEIHKLVGGRIGHVVLDQKASLSIRTELDWRIAEALAE